MKKDQILVADDDALVAKDLTDRLEGLGYHVPITAASALEAVSFAQSLRPDLVLMDVRFPGEMDGIEAAKQIHAMKIPVVYVTGFCDGSMLERAKQADPYGCILKPYQTAELQAAIGIALHKAQREREEMKKQLTDALGRAKILAGLLSVCAYCKKIKDDAGEWEQFEAYIMKRTNASFSHGMCPGCFEDVKRQLAAAEGSDLTPGSLVLG